MPGGLPAQGAGAVLIGAGAVVISGSFVRFAVGGIGTPAPFAQTKHLVAGGFYRFVRNPICLALAAALTGQGLLLGQPKLFGLVAPGPVLVAAFVRSHEEPTLAGRFGSGYGACRKNVPRWLPRLTLWQPAAGNRG